MKSSGKKVLVTGGHGFIGHRVVKTLVERGHTPVVTDTHTNYGVMPATEIQYLIQERIKPILNVETYNFDIRYRDSMELMFDIVKPDLVIHLASYPRQKLVRQDPIPAAEVMCQGLLVTLTQAIKHKVQRFVFVSSSMVYGSFTDDVKETDECNPQGQYGILKLAGEQLVKDASRDTDLPFTIIRPSAVYGPLDVKDRVVAKFMTQAILGESLRVNGANECLDFTYVDDAAEGIVSAAFSPNTKNKIYNITKSHSRSLLEAAELAVSIAGAGTIEVNGRDLDFPSRGSLNIDAARRDFGFNPKIDVEQGFRLYHAWLSNTNFWRNT